MAQPKAEKQIFRATQVSLMKKFKWIKRVEEGEISLWYQVLKIERAARILVAITKVRFGSRLRRYAFMSKIHIQAAIEVEVLLISAL